MNRFVKWLRGSPKNPKTDATILMAFGYGLMHGVKGDDPNSPVILTVNLLGGLCAVSGAIWMILHFFSGSTSADKSDNFKHFDESDRAASDARPKTHTRLGHEKKINPRWLLLSGYLVGAALLCLWVPLAQRDVFGEIPDLNHYGFLWEISNNVNLRFKPLLEEQALFAFLIAILYLFAFRFRSSPMRILRALRENLLRALTPAYLVISAFLLLYVPCTWSHYSRVLGREYVVKSGYTFLWTSNGADISYSKLMLEEAALFLFVLAAYTTAKLIPHISQFFDPKREDHSSKNEGGIA